MSSMPRWRHFVEQGVLDAQVDPLVAMSWRRCLPRHNPYTGGALPRLSEDALQALRVRQFDLIAIARPFMEDIYQCVEQSGYAGGAAGCHSAACWMCWAIRRFPIS